MTTYQLPEPYYKHGSGDIPAYSAVQTKDAYADGRQSVHDACVDTWKDDFYKQAFSAGAASRDAEIEALRADAERYRGLRKTSTYGYPSPEGSNNKDAYLVVTGYGCKKKDRLTDQAVDAVIAAQGDKT